MTGIEQSKKVAALIGGTVSAIANVDSNQDGMVSALEGLNAAQVIVLKFLGNRPDDLGSLKGEVQDWDEAEKAELVDDLKDELSFNRESVETLVEAAVKIVVDVIDFVFELQAAREDQVTTIVV